MVRIIASLFVLLVPGAISRAQDLPPVLRTLDSRWTIDLEPTFDRNLAQIGVPVPIGLYVVARDDFADVRLLSVDPATTSAVELPYELVRQGDTTVRHEIPTKLSGPAQIAEGTQYVLDVGQNPPAVNEIVIDVAPDAHDYHCSVQVFGHDGDGQETSLTPSGLLYDTTSAAGTIRICRVDFPPSRFQHYRLIVSQKSGAPLPVAAIRAVERVETRPAGIELSAVKMSWAMDAGARSSIIESDLNYRKLPTNGVKLDVTYGGGDYCRTARVEVTDLSDDSANWKPAATFELYRLTQSDGTQVECSSVEYPSAYGGYVRVIIDNGDQPPLTVTHLAAVSLPELMICDSRPFLDPSRQVAVYAGDLQRSSPAPQIRRTSPEFDANGLSTGVLVGPRKANPFKLADYDPRMMASAQDQNLAWWLTVGLALTTCMLAALVVWRTTSRTDSSETAL